MNSLFFAVLFIFYYIFHSILADDAVKDKLYMIIPSYLYRIIYSIISIGGLLYLAYIYTHLDHELMFSINSVTNLAGAIVALLGLGIILSSYLAFDVLEFIGIRQIVRKDPKLKDSLNIKGVYRWVRHPMYLGTLIVTLGLIVFYPEKNLFLAGVITMVYTIIGARLEERKLIIQYGDDYKAYQNEVPFIFPIKLK